MRMVNLPMPVKKCLVSQSVKPRSTKRGDDSFETCSDIVPYKGGLPPIGNIVLKGSSPPSTHTRSSRRPSTGTPKPSTPQPSTDAPPSSGTRGYKRKTFPLPPSVTTERKVCYL